MKYVGLAALAAATLAAPAMARDGQAYIGVEGGLLFPDDIGIDIEDDQQTIDDAIEIDFENGFDVDLIAGYDFGMIRAEGELAYKRASADEVDVVGGLAGVTDADGYAQVLSLMGNVLFDFGNPDGFSFYGGGGLGIARVRLNDIETPLVQVDAKESGLAWQLIAGLRYAVSDNIDLGAKYRYFVGPRIEGEEEGVSFDAGRFKSHSLLATLTFNLGGVEAAPPPPPPPPPATQTCPDGSVIMATEACPPPPPPPPPPPEPERG